MYVTFILIFFFTFSLKKEIIKHARKFVCDKIQNFSKETKTLVASYKNDKQQYTIHYTEICVFWVNIEVNILLFVYIGTYYMIFFQLFK